MANMDCTVTMNELFFFEEPVVDCWWLNGAIDCFAKAGFEYNKVVSRTLNVTISHVTQATGKYACQVAGYVSRLLETCELNFKYGKIVFVLKQYRSLIVSEVSDALTQAPTKH